MPPDLSSLSRSSSTFSTPQRRRPSLDNTSNQSPSAMASPADFARQPLQSHGSPRARRLSVSERRQSVQNINHGDTANEFGHPSSIGGSPTIGTGDPHHQRTPSLGELHQELEQEQEAQVNRLLHMIRTQQSQLQVLQQQAQSQQQSATGIAAVDDSIQPSERVAPFPLIPPLPSSNRASGQLSSSLPNRRPSRSGSQATSPSLRPYGNLNELRAPEGLESSTLPGESPVRRTSRDEGSLYQAEASMLSRENQMLRQRIRDLERQISELNTTRSLPAREPGEAE